MKAENRGSRNMTEIKVLIAFCICCSFVGSVSAAAMNIGIGTVSGNTGSIIDVPVTISNAKDLGSMDIVVSYDPAVLSVVSVEKGTLNKGMIMANSDTPGTIAIGIVDANGINGEGAVANIRFKVIGPNGATSPLKITNVLAYNVKTHSDIQTATSSGTITVKQGGLGIPGFGVVSAALAGMIVLMLRKVTY